MDEYKRYGMAPLAVHLLSSRYEKYQKPDFG